MRSHSYLQLQIFDKVLQTRPEDGLKRKEKCYLINLFGQVVYGGTIEIYAINYETGKCRLKSIVISPLQA